MTLRVTRISAAADLLGESPVWDGERQILYWVDGVSRQVHAYQPASGTTRDWQVPSMIGSIGLGPDDTLVAGLADGIYSLDLGSGAGTPVFRAAPPRPRVRLEDRKIERPRSVL